jgi:hypothetical protein
VNLSKELLFSLEGEMNGSKSMFFVSEYLLCFLRLSGLILIIRLTLLLFLSNDSLNN